MQIAKLRNQFICLCIPLLLALLALMGCTVAIPPVASPGGTMPPTPDHRLTDATRITFDPGESSAEIHGNLAARATAFYVLAAQQGQIMAVEIPLPPAMYA